MWKEMEEYAMEIQMQKGFSRVALTTPKEKILSFFRKSEHEMTPFLLK